MLPHVVPTHLTHISECSLIRGYRVLLAHIQHHNDPPLPLCYMGPQVGAPA